MAVQLERLDELLSGLLAAGNDERRHRACAAATGVLVGGSLVGRGSQAGVVHSFDLIVSLEPFRHTLGVADVAFHAERKRLDALDDLEGVERADGRTEVTQQLDSCLGDERTGTEHRPVGESVIARVGLVVVGVTIGVGEVERAAVDDGAGNGRPVAAEELGCRVHDDVGAPLERTDEVGRGDGVVDHERNAGLVGDTGDHLDVEDRVLRVADGLAVEELGVGADRSLPGLGIVGVFDERGLDPELGEGVVQQVVGAAVQRSAGDDVVAGLGDVHDGDGLGRLARRHHERTGHAGCGRRQAAFERRDPGLEHTLRGVHDAGVDVARLGQGEQVRRVLGVLELVGRGLIDRHGACAGCRVGLVPGVNLLGLESPAVGHVSFPCRVASNAIESCTTTTLGRADAGRHRFPTKLVRYWQTGWSPADQTRVVTKIGMVRSVFSAYSA